MSVIGIIAGITIGVFIGYAWRDVKMRQKIEDDIVKFDIVESDYAGRDDKGKYLIFNKGSENEEKEYLWFIYDDEARDLMPLECLEDTNALRDRLEREILLSKLRLDFTMR